MGHDLIKYYSTYLSDYENAHPRDVVPYAILGSAGTASVAARAAQAQLQPGDRIQVWWPLEKNWFAGTVQNLCTEEEGSVVLSYDDGDIEKLKMGKERWRRERVPSGLPSKKRRVVEGGELGGGHAEPTVLPDGSKRKRGAGTGVHWRDFVPTDEAFKPAAPPPTGYAAALHPPPGLGEAGLARFRQKLERRRVIGSAPLTRRGAAFFAAVDDAEGVGGFGRAATVSVWLHQRGFSALQPLFDAHEVDWEVLPLLTGEDLEDLGLHDSAQRRELLVYVHREYNSRCVQRSQAELELATEREGERIAGVNDGEDEEEEEEDEAEAEMAEAVPAPVPEPVPAAAEEEEGSPLPQAEAFEPPELAMAESAAPEAQVEEPARPVVARESMPVAPPLPEEDETAAPAPPPLVILPDEEDAAMEEEAID